MSIWKLIVFRAAINNGFLLIHSCYVLYCQIKIVFVAVCEICAISLKNKRVLSDYPLSGSLHSVGEQYKFLVVSN